MAGFQNFPTRIQDSKLNQITLIKNFLIPKSVMQIINAEKNLFFFNSTYGIYFGADVIEKHITFNREKRNRLLFIT